MAPLFRVGLLLLCLYGSSVSDAVDVATSPDVVNMTAAVLSCNFTAGKEVKGHHWSKNGKEIASTKKDSADQHTEHRLDKIDSSTGGVYNCVFHLDDGNEQGNITVKTLPHVAAYKHSEHGNEKDKVVLVCVSHGFPLPTDWYWYKDEQPIVNNTLEKYEVRSAPNKTTLTIQNLEMEADGGKYICVGKNELGVAEDSIQLRVRSRLAALWPFLGIVAEVVILITVIFIYEKRRKPDEISDDDDSGAAPLKGDVASNHTDKNIRQRNSN